MRNVLQLEGRLPKASDRDKPEPDHDGYMRISNVTAYYCKENDQLLDSDFEIKSPTFHSVTRVSV
jgi:hypothetical protein